LKNVYIVGAGLSGLSAAIHAVVKNFNVQLYESSNLIGGRCRSFFDNKLGIEIDNGNHLVFSANENFYELCAIVGSVNKIDILPPDLNFFDIKENLYWNLDFRKINILKMFGETENLIPRTNLIHYLSILKFLFVNRQHTVSQIVGNSKIFKTFWDPLTLGVMNTSSNYASAKILSNVLKKTIFKGHNYCKIYQPKENWNDTIINPCINFLEKKGCDVKLKKRLKKLDVFDDFVSTLYFDDKNIKIKREDLVIMAIPPSNLKKLFPSIEVPTEYNSIVNVHFNIPKSLKKPFKKKIVGFINTSSHWLFLKKNHMSVTISDANSFNNFDSQEIANNIWKEICSYMKINIPIPEFQVVKEKKATVIQSPSNFNIVKRLTGLPKNLKISGDWTQSELPCTIEGSILSGKKSLIN
tara:strand:- start:218 stop:1450 length:1233 start_codon:yes stop_codon:yes gene_type:complete